MGSIRTPRVLALASLVAFGACSTLQGQEQPPGKTAVRKVEKLERGKDVAVVCRIDGDTTLLQIKPAGTRVKKGDLVGELDPAALKDRLLNQQLVITQAKSQQQNAKVDREEAEAAVAEYVDAIYPQMLQTANGKLSLAEGDRKRAEKALDHAKNMKAKGIVADSEVTRAKLALDKIAFKADQAKTERDLLEKFTKEKTTKKLQIVVERTKQVELTKQAIYLEQKAAADRIEAQIKACKLLAPVDGKVVYDLSIEEGADIRKGQVIFQILPDDKPKATEKGKEK
jgi:multidrug resistance efflux pump